MNATLATAVRPVRLLWRRLTSMRTALILLFLLAVAAVPGSILPQRPLNPDKTNEYIAGSGAWGTFLDRLGMFDVFGSVWFAAIYLLLFVSLVGCLIPRIRLHARAVLRRPLPAPRNLNRLPESGGFAAADSPAEFAAAARKVLGRRWRVTERAEDGGAITVSAEKGYLRETGNLIFHIAVLASLILIAVGRMYNYEGSRIVVQGTGFCNTVSQYDSWKPGRFAAEGKVSPAPFCVDELSKFVATYTRAGQPSMFAADVTYRPNVNGAEKTATITVNHPLRLEGDRLYLIGHGFAPTLTVTMPDGTTRTDTEAFVPADATSLLSEGAFKLQAKPGANQDIGVTGVFAPTPTPPGQQLASLSPETNNPALAVAVYKGDLNYTGLPQSVYSLDTTKMTKLGDPVTLREGGCVSFAAGVAHVGKAGADGKTVCPTLANGTTVTFDGWKPWVSMQVSHDPTQGYLLGAIVAMVLGLIGSLAIRRRRVWLRLTPSDVSSSGAHTVVSVGGLARSDSGNFTTEFVALFEKLRAASTPATELVGVGTE